MVGQLCKAMHHAGPRPTAEKPRAEGFTTHDTWHPPAAFVRSLLGPLFQRLEHLGHLCVHFSDRLEGPDHHLELDDPTFVIKTDDVDTVDGDVIELGHEFENRVVLANDLTDIVKISRRLLLVFVSRPVRFRMSYDHLD